MLYVEMLSVAVASASTRGMSKAQEVWFQIVKRKLETAEYHSDQKTESFDVGFEHKFKQTGFNNSSFAHAVALKRNIRKILVFWIVFDHVTRTQGAVRRCSYCYY